MLNAKKNRLYDWAGYSAVIHTSIYNITLPKYLSISISVSKIPIYKSEFKSNRQGG